MKKNILRGLIIGLSSLILSFIFWKTNIIRPLEWLTWDVRVQLLSNKDKAPENIVVVLVDQDSLDWGEEEQGLSWPWPREILTTIINFASRSGAKAIAFDVLYSEASIYGVSDDEAFKYSISDSNNFIASMKLDSESVSTWNPDTNEQSVHIDGLDRWLENESHTLENYTNVTLPIPEVTLNANRLANVHAKPDDDGIYRRGNLFYLYNDKVIPSLALASYLTGIGNNYTMSINDKFFTINDKIIPINNKAEVILNYRGPSGTYKGIKAAKVINAEIQTMYDEVVTLDSNIFKDSYVIFGYSAAGLLDLRATPLSGHDTGVEIHGTMLDNIITNDFIQEFSTILSIFIALLLSLLAGIFLTKFQGVIKNLFFYLICISIPIFLSIFMYNLNIWYPLVFTELSIILTLTFAGIINYATEGKQKRFIKSAFKQYLSPDFIEHILDDPDKLKLGGEKKEISIFFSDLEGFTTISEGLTPEALTNLINEYLTAMTDIILEEGGTIDKYEGDAIIAFWNAPIDYPDHAVRAVRASLRCQEKLAELRPYFKASVGHNLYMRIGLNTGYAVVGNMGSNTRFDYTMLGDSVNLAARLEGINKQFSTYTMISENTYKAIKGAYPVREVAKVTVVGKNVPIVVYEPMFFEEFQSKKNIISKFNAGLQEFYAGEFKKAISEFRKLIEIDPTSIKYINKCNELEIEKPLNWTGIWEITQK